MAFTPIPSEVFQVFVILLVIYFAVCIALYITRSDKFPIKQRLPKLVVVESCLTFLLATYDLLIFAIPDDPILMNCSFSLFTYTTLEIVSLTILSFRVIWIVLKDLFTKVLLQDESLSRRPTVPDDSRTGRMLGMVIFVLKWAKKWFSVIQIVSIATLPGAVLGLSLLLDLYSHGIVDFLVSSKQCQAITNNSAFLNVGFYLYFSFLSITSLPLLNLKDNFKLEKEIKGFLILGCFMILLILVTVDYNIYSIACFQTRAWNFIIGVVIVPALFGVQLMFPLYLSFRHEEKKKLKIISNLSNQSNPKPGIRTHGARNDMMELLSLAEGREAFLNFLEKEFSVENLFFIEACEAFKSSFNQRSFEQNVQDAFRIRNLFILPTSPHSVNIAYKTRLQVLTSLQSFDNKNRVSKLMAQDSTVSVESSPPSSPLIAISVKPMDALDRDTFDHAREEIIKMLLKDTFLRFKFSQAYNDFCQSRGN
jgi:hypothetical protein